VSTASPGSAADRDAAIQAVVDEATRVLRWYDDSVTFFVCAFDASDLSKFSYVLPEASIQKIQRLHEVVEELKNGKEPVEEKNLGRDHVGDVVKSEEKTRLREEVRNALEHCPNGKTTPLPDTLKAAIREQYHSIRDGLPQPQKASLNGVELSFRESDDPRPTPTAQPNKTIMISPIRIRSVVLTCAQESIPNLEFIADPKVDPRATTLEDKRATVRVPISCITSDIAAYLTKAMGQI
jgi:hypothetical protein